MSAAVITPSAPAQSVPSLGSLSRLAGILLIAVTVDLALIDFGISGRLSPEHLVLLHLLLCPIVWAGTRRGDRTLSTIAVVAVTAMGPLGALGTLFLALSLYAGKAKGGSDKWHRQLSTPVETDFSNLLSLAITEGRMPTSGNRGASNFAEIADAGSILQRQTMLGLISQRFDPSFTPALRQSLKSEDAAVRVSAAAVFSKLRDKNRLQMKATEPTPDLLPVELAVARGLALARGLATGLLDPADAVAARAQSLDFLLSARPQATESDRLEEVIATLLFGACREAELAARLNKLNVNGSAVLRDLKNQMLMRAGKNLITPEQRDPVLSMHYSSSTRDDKSYRALLSARG